MNPIVSLSTVQDVRAECHRLALNLIEIDLTNCCDKTIVMKRIAESLSLPATFGHNWDALVDVLRDLESSVPGLVLMLYGAASLLQNSPKDYAILQDIFETWPEEPGGASQATFILFNGSDG